jgi:signal transduction histidine kinase/tetratricopeptide (TPR) repeat protein
LSRIVERLRSGGKTASGSKEKTTSINTLQRNDSLLVESLTELAFAYSRVAPEQGVKLATEAMFIAESGGSTRPYVQACRVLGWCHYVQSHYAKAMEAYLQGQRAAEMASDAESTNGVNGTNGTNGVNGVNDLRSDLAQLLQYKAIIYRALDDIDRALEHHLQAAQILESALSKRNKTERDSAMLMDIFQDLGIDYRLLNNPQKGREYLLRTMPYFEARHDTANIAINFNNLGECSLLEKRYEQALAEVQRSMALSVSTGLKRMQIFNCTTLARLYTLLGKPKEGVAFGNQALALLGTRPDMHQRKEAYKALAVSYSALSDFSNAYLCQQRYGALHDSIYHDNVRNTFALQQTDVAARKKEAQILLLTKDKERQTLVSYGLLGGIALCGVIGVLMLRSARAQRKTYAEIQRQQSLLTEQAVEIETINTGLQERNIALESSYSSVRVLSEIGQKITSTLDIRSIGMALYNDITAVLDTPIVVVGTYSPERGVIDYTLTIENGTILGDLSLSMSETHRPAVQCVLEQRAIIVQDYQQTHQQALHGDAPASLVYVPLTSPEGAIIGVFSVQSYRKQYFTEQHLNVLGTIVPFVASALSNANAYREIARVNDDLAERNAEIEKQNALLDEQARDIEIANTELQEKNLSLDSALSDLKAAQIHIVQNERMSAVGMLTAGVMHEINNPNAVVYSASNQALKKSVELKEFFFSLLDTDEQDTEEADTFAQLSDSVTKYLSLVRDGSERVKAIVENLQGFTKHQSATMKVGDLRDSLRATIQLFSFKFDSVTVSEYLDAALIIEANFGEVNQILLNLLVNAAQASARNIAIRGEFNAATNTVAVAIADDGTGMSEETVKKIFEPFFSTKGTGNSGLGLSITRQILDKHHANISVESAVGTGTTFTLHFPAAQP